MKSTKYYLGLDVGGTNMVAGVVDENHQIIAKESIPTQAGRTIDEITADMAAVSKKAVLKAGLQIEDISSWGIGMPSYVNPKTNLLVHAKLLRMEKCSYLRLFKEAYLFAYLYSQRRELRYLWRSIGGISQPIYRRYHVNAGNGSRRRNYHG